ncbi:hypothetical protein [Stutzerimonas stutzeri]|uniref:hypothetical protein n=1 Tax=Stutzerimonas stutzeri TaxID=316 RepID=UPI00210C6042|nr:hypothetical protein [Stutzerimonas stutzeri]MCQ4242506.1 hypothetical protein [Stutzerimonas stutzeri]
MREVRGRLTEPAPAQDERRFVKKEICPNCEHQFPSGANPYINQLRAALSARPEQTEQLPVACRECRVIGFRPGMGEVTFYVEGGVPQWMNIGETIYVSDAAPIAQTAPQPEQINLRALLNNGTALSNIAYNLAQRPGVTLDKIVCDTLLSACRGWDAACATLRTEGGE